MVDEASAQSFAVSGIFARKQYVGVPHLVDVRRTHSELIKLFEGNQHEPFAVLCNSSINTRGGPIWIFFRHTGLNAVERQSCCPRECAQRFWIVRFVHVADVLTDGDESLELSFSEVLSIRIRRARRGLNAAGMESRRTPLRLHSQPEKVE